MRLPVCSAALLLLASQAAQALVIDAPALAKYDRSYAQCEAKYPEMTGHRDEAYLKLWRVQLNKTTQSQLDTARKSAAYKTEQRRGPKPTAKPVAPAASSPLTLQCQGLWAEYKRDAKAPAAKPASAPAAKSKDEHKH